MSRLTAYERKCRQRKESLRRRLSKVQRLRMAKAKLEDANSRMLCHHDDDYLLDATECVLAIESVIEELEAEGDDGK